MELSIIVPIYNCEDFLEELFCNIDSLLGDNYEVILVNDGSSDRSGTLCDEFAKNNNKVKVIHKINGGVSSARNAGLADALGEYVGFLDADDKMKSYMYQRLIDSSRQNGSDMVMGGYEKIGADSIEQVFLPFNNLLVSKNKIKKIVWSMAFWNGYCDGENMSTVYGSVWPNLYRRDIIENHNIWFDEELSIGEDLLFNLEYLSFANRVSFVNEPLYGYNVANVSATRKYNLHLWDRYVSLLDKVEKFLISFYGESEELYLNLHQQRLNYAINVAEEQICNFKSGKNALSLLKCLCKDSTLRESAKYICKRGKSYKARIQAILLYYSMARAIYIWLK